MGGTKVAAIWDVIVGAFALHSEPVIHPYLDYSGKTPTKDPFDTAGSHSCHQPPFGL